MTLSFKAVQETSARLQLGGLWAPWKLTKAQQEAGDEVEVTRTLWLKEVMRLAQERHVTEEGLEAAARSTWQRWPTPAQLVTLAATKGAPEALAPGCGDCDDNGRVRYVVHHRGPDGASMVWPPNSSPMGASPGAAAFCGCERGQAGKAREGAEREGTAPVRVWDVADIERRFGELYGWEGYRLIRNPELWERYPMGSERHAPPSPRTLAIAERCFREQIDAQRPAAAVARAMGGAA